MNIKQVRSFTLRQLIEAGMPSARATLVLKVLNSLDAHTTNSQLEAALLAQPGIGIMTIIFLRDMVKDYGDA